MVRHFQYYGNDFTLNQKLLGKNYYCSLEVGAVFPSSIKFLPSWEQRFTPWHTVTVWSHSSDKISLPFGNWTAINFDNTQDIELNWTPMIPGRSFIMNPRRLFSVLCSFCLSTNPDLGVKKHKFRIYRTRFLSILHQIVQGNKISQTIRRHDVKSFFNLSVDLKS